MSEIPNALPGKAIIVVTEELASLNMPKIPGIPAFCDETTVLRAYMRHDILLARDVYYPRQMSDIETAPLDEPAKPRRLYDVTVEGAGWRGERDG